MFLIIPIDVAANTDIKNISKLVYGYLFGHNQMFQSFPTAKQIADDLKKSIKTISISLSELKNYDLINVVKSGRENQYQFTKQENLNNGFRNQIQLENINNEFRNQIDDKKIKVEEIQQNKIENVKSENITKVVNIDSEEINEFLPQVMKYLKRHRINNIPEELLNQFLNSVRPEEILREFENAIKISVQAKPEKRTTVFTIYLKKIISELLEENERIHADLDEFLEAFENGGIYVPKETINAALLKYGRQGMIDIISRTKPLTGINLIINYLKNHS